MKRILIFIPVIFFACQKEEIKRSEILRAKIQFKAEYINTLEKDSIFVFVERQETKTFLRHSDPCFNISFGYTESSGDSILFSKFKIFNGRDEISSGILKFTKEGEIKVID